MKVNVYTAEEFNLVMGAHAIAIRVAAERLAPCDGDLELSPTQEDIDRIEQDLFKIALKRVVEDSPEELERICNELIVNLQKAKQELDQQIHQAQEKQA